MNKTKQVRTKIIKLQQPGNILEIYVCVCVCICIRCVIYIYLYNLIISSPPFFP